MEEVLSPDCSAELVARWRQGDQQAATVLWRRYANRLIALVRSRLSGRLAFSLDAEDVVQSAYTNFFAGARNGRYVVQRSGDLWRLLVAISLHKLRNQIRRHLAGKRSLARERHFGQESDLFRLRIRILARGPSPADAAALNDELEQEMRRLTPLRRQMLELRMQGHSHKEIAEHTGHHERTVRRILKEVEHRLRQRCQEHAER